MSASSAASSSGASSISRRSRSICRARRSRWLATDEYSPTAIEKAPARRPAIPVRTSVVEPTPAPATPRTRDRLETRPSFMPKTAARTAPPRPPRGQRSRRAITARAPPPRPPPMPRRTPRRRARARAQPARDAPPGRRAVGRQGQPGLGELLRPDLGVAPLGGGDGPEAVRPGRILLRRRQPLVERGAVALVDQVLAPDLGLPGPVP